MNGGLLVYWGVASTALNLCLGWWALKLHRHKALTERPWIFPDPMHQGGKPMLGGPNADLWKIEKIDIRKPRRAEFLLQEPVRDAGGSIVEPRSIPAGRRLLGGNTYFCVRSPSWPVELRITIALRTCPSKTSSLLVRMSA